MNLIYLYTVQNETSVIPGVTANGSIIPFRNVAEYYPLKLLILAILGTPTSMASFLLMGSNGSVKKKGRPVYVETWTKLSQGRHILGR